LLCDKLLRGFNSCQVYALVTALPLQHPQHPQQHIHNRIRKDRIIIISIILRDVKFLKGLNTKSLIDIKFIDSVTFCPNESPIWVKYIKEISKLCLSIVKSFFFKQKK
jgi:protein gp37